jgi:molybdate transport system substrate-binding protein
MSIRSVISFFLGPLLLSALFFLPTLSTGADAGKATVTVAVAANALRPIEEIALAFTEAKGIEVRVVHGSTGKLYAQITQGAPFDVFLSADKLRPSTLVEKGFAGPESRFTYARGSLALWTARKDLKLSERGLDVLNDESVKKVAIANPMTAPYGSAAMEAIVAKKLFATVEAKLVFGETVSQAFSYARTGNADVAITSLSTIYGQEGESISIDEALYPLIEQDGVVLKDANKEADRFREFLSSKKAIEIFSRYGYVTDGDE